MGMQLCALVISLTDISIASKIFWGAVAGGYAIWVWRMDYVKRKKEDAKVNDFVEKEIQRRVKEKLAKMKKP